MLLLFQRKSRIWQNSGFSVKGQNPLGQSNFKILESAISYERSWNQVDFVHVDKHQSFLQADTAILDGRVEANTLGQSNSRIILSAISYE